MNSIFPNKLKPGDEVRVIAPSRSMGIISPENKALAVKALENLGLRVTFGKHVLFVDVFRRCVFRRCLHYFNFWCKFMVHLLLGVQICCPIFLVPFLF